MELKGGLIKVGQMLSTRVDIMPPEYIVELKQLQDMVEPYDYDYVASQVTQQLGAQPEEIFAEFDRVAVAAASLGQVHKAKLKDGRIAAVKIQYPHVEKSIEIDFFMIRIVLKVVMLFFPKFNLDVVFREISNAVRQEVDYEQEARNSEEIHANLKDFPGVITPEIYHEYTARKVITMEYIDGVKIDNITALKEMGEDPTEVLTLVVNAYSKQILTDGFFHSDPHPGNLFVLPGPTVAIVDFGQTKRLPPEIKKELKAAVMSWATQNPDMFAEVMVNLNMIKEKDVPLIKDALKKFLGTLKGLTPEEMKQLNFSQIKLDALQLMKSIDGIQIPQDLVLYGRTASLIYGLGSILDPKVNLLTIAQPYLMKYIFSK